MRNANVLGGIGHHTCTRRCGAYDDCGFDPQHSLSSRAYSKYPQITFIIEQIVNPEHHEIHSGKLHFFKRAIPLSCFTPAYSLIPTWGLGHAHVKQRKASNPWRRGGAVGGCPEGGAGISQLSACPCETCGCMMVARSRYKADSLKDTAIPQADKRPTVLVRAVQHFGHHCSLNAHKGCTCRIW